MDSALLSILMPAMAAGLVVLSTHVVMGRQVLARGIIFIDLAIAQIAALGSVLVLTQHDLQSIPLMMWILPALFALSASALVAWLEQRFKQELEALIGCLYVLSAVLALLVLSSDPHGGELMKQLLNGQILWTDWKALTLPLAMSALVLALLAWRPGLMSGPLFYPLFAVVITFSVSLVGIYLVFSSLILPALAVNRISGNQWLLWAYLTGIIGYAVGLVLSASWDLPSGATIVCTLAITAIVVRASLARISS